MANTLSVFFTFTTATCKEDKNISLDVILKQFYLETVFFYYYLDQSAT